MLHGLSKKEAGSSTKFTTPAQGQNYRQGKPPARPKIAFLFVAQKRPTLFKRGLYEPFLKTVRSANMHWRLGVPFAKNTFYVSYSYYRRDLRCLKRRFTSHFSRLSDPRICIGGLALFSGKRLSTLLIRTTKEIYAV